MSLLPVLDGGDEIILANWPNDKHIICNINNDIPVNIPIHPYVFVNRSILCNCGIEADIHHLLESLAACDNKETNLMLCKAVQSGVLFFKMSRGIDLGRQRRTNIWSLKQRAALLDGSRHFQIFHLW